MSLLKGINVVSISVTDLDKARAFYRDVLELGNPVIDLPEMGWIEFALSPQSGHISLTKADAGWQPNNGTTIIIDTADCYATSKTLQDRGVRCDDPVVIPNMVTYFSFYDPFGNRLQACTEPSAG